MVGSEYMLKRPPGPSAARRFLDQKALPVAIDLAGAAEAGLNRLGTAARWSPALALGTAALAGALLCRLAWPRRRTRF